MSFWCASEQLAGLRRDTRRLVEQSRDQEDHALALLTVEDAASRSAARLLSTASMQQGVETLGLRIHGSGSRAQFRFVMTTAGELAVGAQALRDDCGRQRAH